MTEMAKTVYRLRGEAQKNISNLMDSFSGKFSKWEIWQDFIVVSAISIAKAIGGPYREEREQMYLDRIKKYTPDEQKRFAEMFSEVVLELDRDPEQDMLGELFMMLGLSNEWKGQFFTPYDVCRAMAAMTIGDGVKEQLTLKNWSSVNDPACGAGALLIAYANECRRHEINYQTSVLFVAQDIDFLAGCMCYIQLSLLGCPGYVVIDNTLTNPVQCYDKDGLLPVMGPNVWFTPFYYRDVWNVRRMLAQFKYNIDFEKKEG